jgi:hypothetical protein
MDGYNNNGIRVNIHENGYDYDFENENDYEFDYEFDYDNPVMIVLDRSQNPFSQYFFNTGNQEHDIRTALDNVSMLNVMQAFFDDSTIIDQWSMGMSEERMMEIATLDSLNNYKTEEKKPHIKLCISTKIANESVINDICTICVSNFDVGDNITELECKHTHHTDCIAEWVKYKSECPVCRCSISTVDETPE